MQHCESRSRHGRVAYNNPDYPFPTIPWEKACFSDPMPHRGDETDQLVMDEACIVWRIFVLSPEYKGNHGFSPTFSVLADVLISVESSRSLWTNIAQNIVRTAHDQGIRFIEETPTQLKITNYDEFRHVLLKAIKYERKQNFRRLHYGGRDLDFWKQCDKDARARVIARRRKTATGWLGLFLAIRHPSTIAWSVPCMTLVSTPAACGTACVDAVPRVVPREKRPVDPHHSVDFKYELFVTHERSFTSCEKYDLPRASYIAALIHIPYSPPYSAYSSYRRARMSYDT